MNMHLLPLWTGGFCEWLWRTSLQASVLFVLVVALQWLLARWLRPTWRYALSLLVLLRLLLPFGPASGFSVFNLRLRTAPVAVQAVAIPSVASLPQEVEILPNAGRVPSPEVVVAPVVMSPPATEPAPLDSPKPPSFPFDPGLARAAAELVWLAGCLVAVFSVIRRHRRFSRWVRRQSLVTRGPAMDLLKQCRAVMEIKAEVQLSKVSGLSTPALFGYRNPCLLVPEKILETYGASELRLIFLHELAHVKRSDVLLNWVMIVIRALHWFNPLVWLALRRLRSDRELVCDEMVLAQLEADERRQYGDTLIKLVSDFSIVRLCPSLVPAIHHKQEIKRRIIMIAQFKPATRIAVTLSAALVLVVCAFTFTRAADDSVVPDGLNAARSDLALEKPAGNRLSENTRRGIAVLEDELAKREQELKKSRADLDKLRQELQVPDLEAEASVSVMQPETVRMIERDRISAEGSYAQYDSLLQALKKQTKLELRETIPTANPDSRLSDLMGRLNQAENEQTMLAREFSSEHPKLQVNAALIANLNAQIDARVAGILQGLETLAAASKARANELERQVQQAKRTDAENMKRFRPYFAAKREFETEQRIKETIKLRLLQEQIDAKLSGRVQDSSAGEKERVTPGAGAGAVESESKTESPKGTRAEWKRNISIAVPLTRQLLAFVPGNPSNDEADRIVTLDAKGAASGTAHSDKIVVNLSKSGANVFAVARISLISGKDEFLKILNERRERLLDVASGHLAGKTAGNVHEAGFRNLLRAELLALFNQVLGEGMVKEVIISEFLLQQ